MKKTLLLYLAIGLAFFATGCATSEAQVSVHQEETKQVQTQRSSQRLLGTSIGCSKKIAGYTKEACGEAWGRPLDIMWGDQ